ncbi:MAG: cytochrome c oxidase assembly protein [Alphaproteobacteria bacterium GM7ARS4]|nr:cytochrome c oxidase assembly protein [Alphaproteobacteria bacterium GM7ARS4]
MSTYQQHSTDRRHEHSRVGLTLVAVIVMMFALSWASVPLYRLFCQVTGFAGTPLIADSTQDALFLADAPSGGGRSMTMRFESQVSRALGWSFYASQKTLAIPVGTRQLAFYEAKNEAHNPKTGHAIFNVTPLKAAPYFVKIDCFCFQEQTLDAGEHVRMPVAFYIDPAIGDDPYMDDVDTITLSYTFYETL